MAFNPCIIMREASYERFIMTDTNNQSPKDRENTTLFDPAELLDKIRIHSEQLISATQDFIEWTKADRYIVIEELIRMRNFCDAVIEANPITYKLASVIEKTGIDEHTLRKLLYDVGVDINKTAINPQEDITKYDLITLLADRAGSREGDLLAEFIRGNRRVFKNY